MKTTQKAITKPLRNRQAAEIPTDSEGRFKLPEDGWYDVETIGEHPNADCGVVQLIDNRAADLMVQNFRRQQQREGDKFAGILIDEDHFSYDPDKSTQAIGWLMNMRLRRAKPGETFGKLTAIGGELVPQGQIRWSAYGEPRMKGGDFRWFSSVFEPGDVELLNDGRVRPIRLARLAVTNDPNNKGGRPISNRRSSEKMGEAKTDEPKPTKHNDMKSIAIALGLSEDAGEGAILSAIKSLKGEKKNIENRLKVVEEEKNEAQADSDLAPFKNRVPEKALPFYRANLITNRDATLEVLKGLPEPKEEKKSEGKAEEDGKRIHNRSKAQHPTKSATGDDSAESQSKANARAARIRNRAASIAKEQGVRHNEAWRRAEAEFESEEAEA